MRFWRCACIAIRTGFASRWTCALKGYRTVPETETKLGPFVAKLAEFFPGAIRMQMPVRVAILPAGAAEKPPQAQTLMLESKVSPETEHTVIEFGTAREVLFACGLPLEFEDRIRVMNRDGSLDAEAKVVAVQFQDGKMAVAARFTGAVANWIIQSA